MAAEFSALKLLHSHVRPGNEVAGSVVFKVLMEFEFKRIELALIGTEKSRVRKLVSGDDSMEYASAKQQIEFMRDRQVLDIPGVSVNCKCLPFNS